MELIALVEEVTDPVKAAVLRLLASYGGITILVMGLVGGLKMVFGWIKGREPLWAFVLTILTGVAAKFALPYYGTHTVSDWVVHGIALLVVACGAKVGHDALSSPVSKFVKSMMSKEGSNDQA